MWIWKPRRSEPSGRARRSEAWQSPCWYSPEPYSRIVLSGLQTWWLSTQCWSQLAPGQRRQWRAVAPARRRAFFLSLVCWGCRHGWGGMRSREQRWLQTGRNEWDESCHWVLWWRQKWDQKRRACLKERKNRRRSCAACCCLGLCRWGRRASRWGKWWWGCLLQPVTPGQSPKPSLCHRAGSSQHRCCHSLGEVTLSSSCFIEQPLQSCRERESTGCHVNHLGTVNSGEGEAGQTCIPTPLGKDTRVLRTWGNGSRVISKFGIGSPSSTSQAPQEEAIHLACPPHCAWCCAMF